MTHNIFALAQAQQEQMVADRRHLHQNPEPSGQEENTARFVYDRLCQLGIECRLLSCHGVVGHIYGAKPGKTLALRADMDALPMQEKTGAGYCSHNPGVMHACGHDGHTAALLGAAAILCRLKNELQGEVRLLFQPAEENCRGAKAMIAAGALQGVDTVFGMHVTLEQPAGRFDISAGVRTCAADRFALRFVGGGNGPGSQAVRAAATAVSALQTLASREVDPKTVFALSCCQMDGGLKEKGDAVRVEGTCRYSDLALYDTLAERMLRIARGVSALYGVAAQLELQHIAYPLVNQPQASRRARESAAQLFGPDSLFETGTDSVSEDFSEYLRLVDGCYGKLGANHRDMRLVCPNHNPGFDLNEEALCYGASLFVQYALNTLRGPAGL